jgi:hypothetical protein
MAATKTTSKKTSPRSGPKADSNPEPDTTKPVDAIKLLKGDHEAVKAYFREQAGLKDDTDKQAFADKIRFALAVHTQIEDEICNPATREATDDEDLLDEAEVGHASAQQLIIETREMKAGDRLFGAKIRVLGEYVDHYVAEENEMIPNSRDSNLDLNALGAQLAERKAGADGTGWSISLS